MNTVSVATIDSLGIGYSPVDQASQNCRAGMNDCKAQMSLDASKGMLRYLRSGPRDSAMANCLPIELRQTGLSPLVDAFIFVLGARRIKHC